MRKAIIISCFEWYKQRLEPIRNILCENNYEVSIYTSDFDHTTKSLRAVKYKDCTYIHVPEYRRNLSLKRIYSHLCFGKEVEKIIFKEKPDLLYVVVPPNYVAKKCAIYKNTYPEVKLIVDVIDLWPESLPIGKVKKMIPSNAWRKWRDNAIKVADYVFTECDYYKELLKDTINPELSSTLYLFKEQTDNECDLVQSIIKQKKQDDIIRFAYLGSMNTIIDIEGICHVIQQFIAAGYSCELHAIGDGESKDKFNNAVSRIGCKTYFYGPLFDEIRKIQILAPCDFALNMMKDETSVGLTIKSIDYLSYGLPLINNIKGDTWQFVSNETVGINVGSSNINISFFDHEHIYKVSNVFSKAHFMENIRNIL